MSLFPTGIRKDDEKPPRRGSKKHDIFNYKDALVALVKLCEKETHKNSGTIMFSKYRKEYQKALKLVKQVQ